MLTVDRYIRRNDSYDWIPNIRRLDDSFMTRSFVPTLTNDEAADYLGESDAETIREVLK